MQKKCKILFVSLFALIIFQTSALSQNNSELLSINAKNVTLAEIMSIIESQSSFTFFYDTGQIDLSRVITLNVKDKSIHEIMPILLKGTNINYKIADHQIALIISPDEIKSTRNISGIVTDANNVPLIGVAVIIHDTNKGVVTNNEGKFNISVSNNKATYLRFNYLGYEEQTVPLPEKKDFIKIILAEESIMMDETVVIGYGSQKKVNLTGAISTVSSDQLQNRASSSLTHMLQGNVPGLNITTASGRPGNSATINIRGVNSINGGSPLVLIDGYEGTLQSINANDVESISVIKDASSSAIYGARASFGVIMITTKQGKASDGKAKVSYSGRMGWTSPTTSTDYETRGYYSVYINDLFQRSYSGVNYTNYTEDDMKELWDRRNDKIENPDRPWVLIDQRSGRDTYVYYANTDWYHYLYQDTRPTTSHNISLSGGTERVKYYLSGRYYYEEGMIRSNSDYANKFNLKSRISFDVNDWINISNNTSYYNYSYYFPGLNNINTIFGLSSVHALASFPTMNPDGTSIYRTALARGGVMDGLLTILDKGLHKNYNKSSDFSTTFEITLMPIKELEVKGNFTYLEQNSRNQSRRVNTSYSMYPGEIEILNSGNMENFLNETSDISQYMQSNIYATFADTYNNVHNLKIMAGFNYETKHIKNLTARGYNLLSENLNDLNLVGQGADGLERMEVSGGQNEYALAGFFGRINYDYEGKYLFEASGRYDGTSRFGSNHRWGFFPSASIGWRISEEEFFSSLKNWFSNLKIRYSIGSLGNQQVGYYDYIRKISIGNQNYLFGDTKPTTATISAPVASDLTWEIVQHQNLGIDMAFFKNKLTFTGEAYIRNTKNMLTEGVALPSVYGAASPKMNSADLRTQGYELSLGWKDTFTLLGKPMSYSATVIFSDYTSRITKYDNPDKTFAKDHYVGETIGEIWGYRTAGLFMSDEEAASWPVDQSNINTIINSSAGTEYGLRGGDVKFLDLDGDNTITLGANTVDDPGDREIIGNRQPRYNYGISLGFAWYDFDISVFFQGIGHIDWYPSSDAMAFWGPYARPYASFIPKDFHKMYWTEDNKDAYFPRPRGYVAMGSNRELSVINDRYLQNIGYCRLKNLTIGYSLPKKWMQKINIESIRLYFTGENLHVWSGIKSDYIDPEMAMQGGQLKLYPWQKTFMFGIDINF